MRSILEMLACGEYVSGERMSEELGISRPAVWKRIAQLKEQGWQIEAAGRKGYRLLAGDSLDPRLWVGSLTTRTLGRGDIRYEDTVTSTNTVVKEMHLQGAPAGSLCLCEMQTAGKGRLGRKWESPAGAGLWQSVLLKPLLSPERASLITLCAAMAVARAVEETSGVQPRIKWPNDVIVGKRKLCGILLEMISDPDAIESIIVGVGINIRKNAYPPELAERAISL